MSHVTAFAASSRSARRRLLARGALLVTFTAFVALAGCSRSGSGEGGKAAAPGGAPGAGGPPPALPVHVVEMQPRSVPIQFEVVGQVEGSKEVEVRARVYGTLEKQDYKEGDPVHAGQLLFEIDPAPYEIALAQAKAVLAQNQAKLAQARRDETRLKPLAADRAVSQKEYDDAVAAAQTGEAAVQQAAANVREAELNLSYTKVKAPVSGISGRAVKSIGSLVTTDANGSLLTTINQVTPIYVRFSLAPTDLARIPGGRITRNTAAQVSLVLPDGSVYPTRGRLNFAATAIDPTIGTQQLRAEFDNPNQVLLPGQFVRVRITAGERSNVFLVPQDAVIQTEKGSLVFVVGPDGKATPRPIVPGVWYGTEWEILQGLHAGDRVIVDNLLKVRPGAPVTAVPAAPPTAGASAQGGAGAQGGAASGGAPGAGGGAPTSGGGGAPGAGGPVPGSPGGGGPPPGGPSSGTPATSGAVGTQPGTPGAQRGGPASAPTGTPGAASNATPNVGNNPSPGQGEPAGNATRAGTANPRSGSAK
jgi:membrane fusion protein (multidrug efflux system)